MKPWTRAAALGAAVLVPLFARAPAAAPRRATQQAVAYTYRGTLRSVDPKTNSLDLITGVGMALRLVAMRAAPTTQISAAGVAVPFAQLKSGDVVRIECHSTPAGMVADKIEKLPEGGGTR